MKGVVYLFSLLLLSGTAFSAIQINELMYNPSGSDNNREYVEVYSDGINLSNYIIEDSSSQDILELISHYNGDYSLIVEEGFNYSGINASIYSVGATIGNNLNNDFDMVVLKDNSSNVVDAVSYSGSWGGNDNGYSICRIPDQNGLWDECISSPGKENIELIDEDVILDYVIDGDTIALTNGERVRLIGIDTPEVGDYYWEEAKERLEELIEGKDFTLEKDIEDRDKYNRLLRYIYVNDTFVNMVLVEEGYARAYPYDPNTKYEEEFAAAEESAKESMLGIWLFSQNYEFIEISEFLPDPAGNDDAAMPSGEWVELYNSGNRSVDLKGLIVNDNYGNGMEISDVSVINETVIGANDYLIIYRNGNGKLELNNDGPDDVVLSYEGITIDSVSYSDSIEGNSYAYVEGIGWQNTMPTPGKENINYDYVKDSAITIESVYDIGSDNEAEFGQTIRVKLNIYKGDSTKNTIYVWVEDDERISKKTKMNIYEKYSNHTLTIPVFLDPNCDGKYKDGDYDVIAEGLDSEDRYEIDVNGIANSVCEVQYVEKDEDEAKKFSYELVDFKSEAYIGERFPVKVKISCDKDPHTISVWSYVYRGNKCYSGSREDNKKELYLNTDEVKTITLYNKVGEAEQGEYKLKVMINKDNQKTNKEITEEIDLKDNYEKKETGINEQLLGRQSRDDIILSSKSDVIFESKDEKIKKLILYFLLVLSVFLNIAMFFNR